jgi:hypothetical protein
VLPEDGRITETCSSWLCFNVLNILSWIKLILSAFVGNKQSIKEKHSFSSRILAFCPKDTASSFLQNTGNILPHYTVWHPKMQTFSLSVFFKYWAAKFFIFVQKFEFFKNTISRITNVSIPLPKKLLNNRLSYKMFVERACVSTLCPFYLSNVPCNSENTNILKQICGWRNEHCSLYSL